MPKVFVTQVPNKRDKATGALVPVFDISPAQEYGEIVTIMPAGAVLYDTKELVRRMRSVLLDYNFNAGDCLLAAGDPAIIATAGAVLGKSFRLLKWEKEANQYIPVEVRL